MYIKHIRMIVLSIGITAWFSGCDCIPRRDSCQHAEHCCMVSCQPEECCSETKPASPKQETETDVAPPPPAEKPAASTETMEPESEVKALFEPGWQQPDGTKT